MASMRSIVLLLVCAANTHAADWPTCRGDNQRTGSTAEKLTLPLKERWVYAAPAPPTGAWAGHDDRIIEGLHLRHRQQFDDAFHVASAGGKLYFGSSVDHQMYCWDLATGKKLWSFFTGAAIRLAPSVWQGRLYFGSDDGHAYCLNADSGRLVWKLRPGPVDEWLLGRGEMMSRWPVRSGVAVQDGVAYFAAGIFPHEDIFLYAVDAATGKVLWKRDDLSQEDAGRNPLSPQGYLLTDATHLVVPSGRSLPAVFERKSGKLLHQRTHSWRKEGVIGGTRALLADDQNHRARPSNWRPAPVRDRSAEDAVRNAAGQPFAECQPPVALCSLVPTPCAVIL